MRRITRFYRCPQTGERAVLETCRSCPAATSRGPATGEAKVFPYATLFCDHPEASA